MSNELRDKNNNYASLKKFADTQGIELFGVADIQKIKIALVSLKNYCLSWIKQFVWG